MPLILSAFWKIYQPIAAVLAPVLLFALIGVWIADGFETHGLRDQLVDANKVISGLRAQSDRLNDNLAIAHANGDTLATALADQTKQVDAWQTAAAMASKRASQALSDANVVSASYEKQIAALLNAKAGESVCTSALDLIQMAGAP